MRHPGRISRSVGRLRPPPPGSEFEYTPVVRVRSALLAVTLGLGLSLLLASAKVVEIADRLPLGSERDRWLEAADAADRFSNLLAFNRPFDTIRDWRGVGEAAGEAIDTIGDVEELLALAADSDPVAERESGADSDPLADRPSGEGRDAPADAAETETPSQTEAGTRDSSSALARGAPDPADAESILQERNPSGPSRAGSTEPQQRPPNHPDREVPPEARQGPQQTPREPQPYRRPQPLSNEAPLRVYVAGDSQAFHLGHELQERQAAGPYDVTLDQRHSSGLARPSYFNWPAHLVVVAHLEDPELFVLTLGSNDWQGMRINDDELLSRRTDPWRAEWSRRLAVMLDALNAEHRHIVWVGLPPTEPGDLRIGYAEMNSLAAEVAAEREFVTMIDIWDMFGGDDPYRASIAPPTNPDASPVLVRQQDGVHLNRRGAEWVVDLIEGEIARIWRDEPDAMAPDDAS